MLSHKFSRRSLGKAAAAGTVALALPGIRRARAAVTLQYANASNEGNLANQFVAAFAEEIKARTSGELEIEILLNMGSEQSILDGVTLGTLDMALVGYSGLPEFDVFYTPYLLRSIPHGVEVFEGPLGERAAAALKARYKARLIGVGSTGPFVLAVKEPVQSWADLKNRKIRVPPFESYTDAVKLLDAVPTPVPFNEVYVALQQGVAEGVVTVLNVMIANKFLEVSKYCIRNDFGVGLDKFLISERSWDGLSPALQKTFNDTYAEMAPKEWIQRAVDNAAKDYATWEQINGQGTVVELDGATIETLMEPLGKRLADEVYGPGAYETIKNT